MAALAEGRLVQTKQSDALQGGYVLDFQVVASDTIYRGALVTFDAGGLLTPAAVGAGKMCIGLALETVVQTASSVLKCQVLVGGAIQQDVASTTIANIGDPVFATDDQTLVLTQGTNPYAGQILQFISGDECIVQMPRNIFQTPVYTVTNHTVDRTFDADTAADAELADVLGTLIIDLKNAGALDAAVSA